MGIDGRNGQLMDYQFATFQPRKTTFIKVLQHGDWRIKLYTINEKEAFDTNVVNH